MTTIPSGLKMESSMPFNTVLSAGFAKDGMFMVMRQDNQWNFVHEDVLAPICEQWFDQVRPFSEGFAAVCTGGKWTYVDMAGNLLTDPKFTEVKDFGCKYGAVRVKKAWKYIDEEGMLHGIYSSATQFKNGKATVSVRGKYYIITSNFEKVAGPFDYATNILSAGTVIVRDQDGQRVLLL